MTVSSPSARARARTPLSTRSRRTRPGPSPTTTSTQETQGTETFERTKDLAVREQIDARLADIDAALDKIEAGTYGQCEICGRVIDPARLEARPSVRYCYEHQQQSDDAAEQERLFGPD